MRQNDLKTYTDYELISELSRRNYPSSVSPEKAREILEDIGFHTFNGIDGRFFVDINTACTLKELEALVVVMREKQRKDNG